ncbi:MAG: Hsp20/alpha crystallin family protein [Candidatus Micrarchaeota archaeon]|nr:Hsp20/alpha crystallin family protein [Candidatus Micrarchaeota archaeon]
MGFFDFFKGSGKGTEQIEESVEPVSTYETKDEFIVNARLPGVAKDEISLNITPTSLTLRVERKRREEHEKKAEGSYAYSAESEVKSFSQTISFAASVHPREAKASFKNGVLEVRLPKHKTPAKGTFVPVR